MDLAAKVYDLYNFINDELREDLIVFVEAHIEPYEADGETHWRMKTNGQKLTKLNLNGKLNYNLYSHVEFVGNDQPAKFWLITQNNGRNECRSAEGVLPYKMPNDLGEVEKLIRESNS